MRVIINDEKYIPGVGQGPVKSPVSISEDLYRRLVVGGYTVIRIKTPKPVLVENDSTVNSVLDVKTIDKTSEEIPNEELEPEVEDKEEEPLEVAPVVEEENEDDNVEILDDTPEENVSSDENYEGLTVKDLKEMLDEKGIKYKYSSRRDELVDLLNEN